MLLNSLNNKQNPWSDRYYGLLAIIFTSVLIGSNLAATKICNFFGVILDGGTFLFPVLYVMSDIITEVYGYRLSRKVIRTALIANVCVSLFLYSVTYMPKEPNIATNDSFDSIFSISPRIFIASIISYYIGEILNAYILSVLKIKLASKLFVVRALFSTFIGASVESCLFCLIAFYGIVPFYGIMEMSVIQAIIKISYEIAVMPITIKLVHYFKQANQIAESEF